MRVPDVLTWSSVLAGMKSYSLRARIRRFAATNWPSRLCGRTRRFATTKQAGALLSRVYTGAWRDELRQLDIPIEETPDLLGSLLHDGGAGLLWPRIRENGRNYGAVGEILERTYNQYAESQRTIASEIAVLSAAMAEAGIEAVVVKGWRLSSRYAAPQIRRPGDIDLIVPTQQFSETQGVVQRARVNGVTTPVDLHHEKEWHSKGNCPSADFRKHLGHVECDGVRVPVLDSSDALRHVCLHAIRHFRGSLSIATPIWLCDIGVLIENPATELDWERVLGANDAQRQWVMVAIALARDLVGVDPRYLPPEIQDFHLPTWSTEAVMERWADPIWSVNHEVNQHGILGAVRRVWPSKLNAALFCRVPLDRRFYFPYQLWTFTRRMTWYLGYELPRNVMARRRNVRDRDR